MKHFLPLLLLVLAGLVTADIASDLAALLSPGARVVVPHDSDWTNLTSRWDPYAEPDLRVSVEAATAADVQATVKYAAQRQIKLLIRNTSHGFTETVESVVNGIQISIRALNSVKIDASKNTATVGGGVMVAEFIDALWKAGKRSATGNCDCVGMMGAGLGGGHGRHQGLHGLVSDNILSARLVLANGTLATVSASTNPGLFWALRGAGHNFGVVVEYTAKVYDPQDADVWTNAEYIYPDASLEAVFSFLNAYKHQQPAEMTIFANAWPVEGSNVSNIRLSIQYGGHKPFSQIAAPFLALHPISMSNSTISYPQIATATGIGLNMGFCLAAGTRRGHFSTQLKDFVIPAIREMKEYFDDTRRKYPQLSGTGLLWEMYPQQAFKAIPAEESAYPHRDLDIISLFMVNWTDEKDDELARSVGELGRDVLIKSTGKQGWQVYVNYAFGDERNEVVYEGGEPWRLKRLRKLKRRFDPHGVWGAYMPIVV
ncbi:FAD-binding domain-containing protein [Wilcoxina mikolae CBS 423.85]|nr:FAD-binding domain-containing protein [Wilcoxina mikolae CBS 423.85]